MATLDVEGTINGVDLNELITLHDDQHIPGNVTFAELHVMEELEVHGEIHGKGLDQHLFDNPTLLQAKSIEAACHFGELHIDGPVIVRESLDGENLDDLLADVVYDTDGTVEITGQKHFKSVEFHESVTIKSGMVNDIKLEDFVTRSTEQTFNVSDIKGNISIGRLTLDGLFDGLNVTEIDMNSIKLYGDQYTEATLIFKNPAGGARPDIEANELRIEKMLNSKNRSEYLQTHQEEELVLTGNITVKNLTVDKLHLISSSLDGPGKMINDIHLPTFDRQRLSLTRPQEIDTPVFIEKLIVEQTANVTFVNGKNISQLSTIEDKINNLKKELLLGKIKIENLYVEGDIKVNMLNDIKFDELLKNVIWLNRPNFIPGTVHFLEPLYIKGNLTVEGLVNNVNFGEFLADLVLKSDEVMEFYEPKIFKNGFHVEGNLDTERINDIRIDELILKNQSIHITGDVTIHGQLFVNHLLIEDSLNGEPIQKLVDHYQYDAARDVHIIKGDVTLHNASIQSLYVQGGFNEIPNLDLHLASLIRKDQDYNFTEPFVFGGEVIFEQGFTVQTVNGRDISRLQYDIVRINEDDPVELMGGAVFTEPLHIETLTVDGDMIAPSIDGYNPDRWPETSVMINEDVEIFAKIIFEPGTFQTEHIDAKFVNGYSMDEVVTLHTDQVFNTTLYIDEMTISQPLEVGGKVNGLYFPDERENTVMTYGTQHIRIPTVFNSIQVRESLTLPALVNDKPFDPVLIGPKMVIESPVVFQHLVVDNLETRDTISGIDFDRWYNDSLWTAGREHQVIPAKLIADEVRFESSVEGNGMINGVNIQEVVQQIEANKQANEERLEYYKTQFRSFCEKTQDLVGKSQNRLYFFKYFTQRQMISMSYEINSFHFFDHLGYHFLAINSACETHVYQWDSTGKMFVPLLVSYTGAVEHWENVVDSDRAIFLLAKSFEGSFQCNVTGVSVWLFTGVELRLMWHTDEPYSAISSLGEKHDSFFVLAENTVIEYRVNGDLIEQWDLPVSATGYRFVRNIVELGLALSDGRLLVLLSNVNNNEDVVRTKRNTNETVQMGLFATQAMYDRMHRNLTRNHVRTSVIEPVTFTDHIKPNVRAAQPASKQINRTLVNVDNWKSTSVLFRNASINDPAPEASTLVKTTISREMPMGGIFTAENYHFPNNPDGEIISFRVGESSYKQQLVAVSTVVDTIIRGDHDAVKIYHDIQLGQLYQILPCNRPSHLTALELRDETLLVFLESRQTVQIYSYRGAVEGFVRLSSFRLTVPVVQMSAISLPQPARLLLCPKHYLAIATQQHELIFLKAKMHGNCGLTVELDCTTED